MNENTLSANLERIKDAVDDIRTTVNKPTQVIEEVAQAVEDLAETSVPGVYKVATPAAIENIQNPSVGNICIVDNSAYTYTSYTNETLTNTLTFPASFESNYSGDFANVVFFIHNTKTNTVDKVGKIYCTNGTSSGCGSGSGGSSKQLTFELKYPDIEGVDPEFELAIDYIYDESFQRWERLINNLTIKRLDMYNDTIIFPYYFQLGYKETSGDPSSDSLPSIIYDCLKLNQIRDFSKNTATNFIYLPKLVNYTSPATSVSTSCVMTHSIDRAGMYNNSAMSITTASTSSDFSIKMNVNGLCPDSIGQSSIEITYSKSGNTHSLQNIKIKDIAGNYTIFQTNLGGMNSCFVQLPFEIIPNVAMHTDALDRIKPFIKDASINKPYTYVYKASIETDATYWDR